MKRWIALTLMLVFLLGAFAQAEDTSLVGQAMPDFTFTTTEGDSHSLSELLAEKDLVILNVFTSWCPPCRMEFPEMEAVYRDLSDRMEIVMAEQDRAVGRYGIKLLPGREALFFDLFVLKIRAEDPLFRSCPVCIFLKGRKDAGDIFRGG